MLMGCIIKKMALIYHYSDRNYMKCEWLNIILEKTSYVDCKSFIRYNKDVILLYS